MIAWEQLLKLLSDLPEKRNPVIELYEKVSEYGAQGKRPPFTTHLIEQIITEGREEERKANNMRSALFKAGNEGRRDDYQ